MDPNRRTVVMVHAGTTTHAAFSPQVCGLHVLFLSRCQLAGLTPECSSGAVWQFIDARLAEFNLVAFDCRMHGRSTGDVLEKFTMEVR